MTPKIDYKLLGRALAEYEKRGYQYVEVPWSVEERFIRATLPADFEAMQIGVRRNQPYFLEHMYTDAGFLVGSAEQGFLSMNLPCGAYVGVTPCYRIEPVHDLFHQEAFLKVELFVNHEDECIARVMGDAQEVMGVLGDKSQAWPMTVATEDGFDLEIGGVEVGSYGFRQFEDQKWTYGTGLALPRFSVAKALATVC